MNLGVLNTTIRIGHSHGYLGYVSRSIIFGVRAVCDRLNPTEDMVAEQLVALEDVDLDERNEEESPHEHKRHDPSVADLVTSRLQVAEVVIAEHSNSHRENIYKGDDADENPLPHLFRCDLLHHLELLVARAVRPFYKFLGCFQHNKPPLFSSF